MIFAPALSVTWAASQLLVKYPALLYRLKKPLDPISLVILGPISNSGSLVRYDPFFRSNKSYYLAIKVHCQDRLDLALG